MATVRQEELAAAIVRNKSLPHYKRKNKKELLVSAGYSEITATASPQKIIEQKGVQETLSRTGLTKDLITEALVFDIENKPKRRERELRLGAEILGILEEKREGNKTLIINITGETATRYKLLDAINQSTSTDSDRPAQV